MTLLQAEQALASQPVSLTVMQDCVLVEDPRTPHARTLSRHLDRCNGDAVRVERLVNRRFIVADLLDAWMEQPLSFADGSMTPEACAVIGRVAETYAATLRDALHRAFPGESFAVELIGVDYAEEEPLEVGVTFSHAG